MKSGLGKVNSKKKDSPGFEAMNKIHIRVPHDIWSASKSWGSWARMHNWPKIKCQHSVQTSEMKGSYLVTGESVNTFKNHIFSSRKKLKCEHCRTFIKHAVTISASRRFQTSDPQSVPRHQDRHHRLSWSTERIVAS